MGYLREQGLTKDIAASASPIIVGVENGVPGNMIQDTEGQEFYNRLANIDGINRARPGVVNAVNANSNPVLYIKYFTGGIYLATDGTNLWSWNSASRSLSLLFNGLPFNPALGRVNGCTANNVMFLNQGGSLYYWDGSAWNTVSMPVQSPLASFPIWATQRLIYAATGTNNVVFGDIDSSQPPNFGPGNNSTTVTVKLDNDNRDFVNGIGQYAVGTIIVGKRSSLWAIYADPTLAVADFSKQQISQVVGIAEHNTIKQIGNDLMFLSESGNGVFKLSTLPGTSNIGISTKASRAISSDIERINWTFVSLATAEVWQDLYILSVPVDGSSTPNAIFIYSAALDSWQGIWTGATSLNPPIVDGALSVRAMGVNPTAAAANGLTAGAELLYGLSNGNIAIQTKPRDGLYNDQAIGGAAVQINSRILTKAYSPAAKAAVWSEAAGTAFNQIDPYVVKFRFPQSSQPITLDLISDVGTLLNFRSLGTTPEVLQLPANLPWNLDSQGSKYQTVNCADINTCQELAFQITGTGDWRIQNIVFGAFISEPQDAI